MYSKTILPNNLKIYTHEVKDRDSVALGVWFNVGGRYEEEKNKGLAHFLEHIVFKGSQKYSCEELKQSIEGVGGALNAFTSEEQTCYYAKIPSKHLRTTFDVLADMAFFPKIDDKDIKKEKTVILEEIKMYYDLPQYHVLEQLDALVWPDHPLGQSIAGTQQSVSAIDRSNLRDYHRAYYGPANAGIVACGRIKHDLLVKLAKAKLGGLSLSSNKDFQPAPPLQRKAKVKIEERKIEQMHLALGMPGYDYQHKDRYTLALLHVILGGNMSSRLFVEVREKHGLAYSISSSIKLLKDTGMFMVRAGVDNERLVKALELILKELGRIAAGVSDNELKRAHDYTAGQISLGLEDTMEHMLWIGESAMARGRPRTLKEVLDGFKKVTRADVKRVAREVLDPGRFNLSLVGPVTAAQSRSVHALLGVR
jgi:predicted Zn-dependent peptidase